MKRRTASATVRAPKAKFEVPAKQAVAATSNPQVIKAPGSTVEEALAGLVGEGVLPSAMTALAYGQVRQGEGWRQADIGCLTARLRMDVAAAKDGDLHIADRLLVSQSVALDAIFNRLMTDAIGYYGSNPREFERYLRLGLKAQSQCRATLESLSAIKNPRSVAFIHQANVAGGHQQINNGATPPADAAKPSSRNELLEVVHGEWVDTGTAGTTVGGDPAVAPVGAINGTPNAAGKGGEQQERLERWDSSHAQGTGKAPARTRRKPRGMG